MIASLCWLTILFDEIGPLEIDNPEIAEKKIIQEVKVDMKAIEEELTLKIGNINEEVVFFK